MWKERPLPEVLQTYCALDVGYLFTMLDLWGHSLAVQDLQATSEARMEKQINAPNFERGQHRRQKDFEISNSYCSGPTLSQANAVFPQQLPLAHANVVQHSVDPEKEYPQGLCFVDGPPPPAEPLHRAYSVASRVHRITWTLKAQVLNSTNRNKVSPSFDLQIGNQAEAISCKLFLHAKGNSNQKGGSSFRSSKPAKGYIQLGCSNELDQPTIVRFRLFVGHQPRSSVVQHDFCNSQKAGLPSGEDVWDLAKSVQDGYFAIGVEFVALD